MLDGAFLCAQVYAAAFFAIPAVRWVLNKKRNVEIEARNSARMAFAKALQSPDGRLRQKLESASRAAQRQVITDRDIIYSSAKDLSDQDSDELDFDRRLASLEQQQGSAPSKTKMKDYLEW